MAGWESCRHSARHRLGIAFARPVLVESVELDTYMHCLNAFKCVAILGFNNTESNFNLISIMMYSEIERRGDCKVVAELGAGDA